MDVNDLLKQLEAEGAIEKQASSGSLIDPEDPMTKLAWDLFAGGRMFGKGIIAELQKFAAEKVESSLGNPKNDKSNWKNVAKKIQARHGVAGQPASNEIASSGTGGTTEKKTPGENPNVVYEAVKPKQVENPNPSLAHGNK